GRRQRWAREWSTGVCCSELDGEVEEAGAGVMAWVAVVGGGDLVRAGALGRGGVGHRAAGRRGRVEGVGRGQGAGADDEEPRAVRAEERRVGKGGRVRGAGGG